MASVVDTPVRLLPVPTISRCRGHGDGSCAAYEIDIGKIRVSYMKSLEDGTVTQYSEESGHY